MTEAMRLRPACGNPEWFVTCELIPWRGERSGDFCRWCGATELPGRRRNWCSDACRETFLANHFWAYARPAALDRRRSCERCGCGNWMNRIAADAFDREWSAYGPWWDVLDAGGYTLHPAHDSGLHAWDRGTWPPEVFAAVKSFEAFVNGNRLEVDHIVPLARLLPQAKRRYEGKRYSYRPSRHANNGCHHHQTNLWVLCHTCHVEKTREDRAYARGERTRTFAEQHALVLPGVAS